MPVPLTQQQIDDFTANVLAEYQAMGSKMRNLVTTENVGNVPHNRLTPNGSLFDCTLYDYYTGDWVDYEELLVNNFENPTVHKGLAYAIGRKTDEIIINKMDSCFNFVENAYGGDMNDVTEGFTAEKVHGLCDMLSGYDDEKFVVVGWKQWSDLLNISGFSRADYVHEDELPWRGTQGKRFEGALWMPHSGLTKATDVRFCYAFTRGAIGHKIGRRITADVSWHGDRTAYFVNLMCSQGSVGIDPDQIVSVRCKEFV